MFNNRTTTPKTLSSHTTLKNKQQTSKHNDNPKWINDSVVFDKDDAESVEKKLSAQYVGVQKNISEKYHVSKGWNNTSIAYRQISTNGSNHTQQQQISNQYVATLKAENSSKDLQMEALKTELLRSQAEMSHSSNLRQQVAIMVEQSNIREQENDAKNMQFTHQLKEQSIVEQELRDEIVRLQHEKLENERHFNVKMTGADARAASLKATCQQVEAARAKAELELKKMAQEIKLLQSKTEQIRDDSYLKLNNMKKIISEKEREEHGIRTTLGEVISKSQRLEVKVSELNAQIEMKNFDNQLLNNAKNEQDILCIKQGKHIQELNDEKSALELRSSLVTSFEEKIAALREFELKHRQAQAELHQQRDKLSANSIAIDAAKSLAQHHQVQITDLTLRLERTRTQISTTNAIESELEFSKSACSELQAQLHASNAELHRIQMQSEERRDRLLVAESRLESTIKDVQREVIAAMRTLHQLTRGENIEFDSLCSSKNEEDQTVVSDSSTAILPVLLGRLNDMCARLCESLKSERLAHRAQENEAKRNLDAISSFEIKLEEVTNELDNARQQRQKYMNERDRNAVKLAGMRLKAEDNQREFLRCVDTVAAHMTRVTTLIGSRVNDFDPPRLRKFAEDNGTATAFDVSLNSLSDNVETYAHQIEEDLESTQNQLNNMQVCYAEAKRNTFAAKEQLSSQRERLNSMHRTALESTKHDVEIHIQRTLTESRSRFNEKENHYKIEHKRECSMLLEACRLLYRAYVPSTRRVHELIFQKTLLMRRVHNLEKLQTQLNELAAAMTGNVSTRSRTALLNNKDNDHNARESVTHRIGTRMFRVIAIVVLASARLRSMGASAFYLGAPFNSFFSNDSTKEERELLLSGCNTRLLPVDYVRIDQVLPSLIDVTTTKFTSKSSCESSSSFIPQSTSLVNFGRILLHFDRQSVQHGASNASPSVYNCLITNLGQGLARVNSVLSSNKIQVSSTLDGSLYVNQHETDAENALVLIRTMALTLARRLKQLKDMNSSTTLQNRTLSEKVLALIAERDELCRSVRKDAGVTRFLEQRIQELQSEVMQMVPHECFESSRIELHQLKKAYYEVQHQRQRLSAEHDISTHENKQLQHSIKCTSTNLHAKNIAVEKLQSLLHLREEEVRELHSLLRRSRPTLPVTSIELPEQACNSQLEAERDHNLKLIREQIAAIEDDLDAQTEIKELDEGDFTSNDSDSTTMSIQHDAGSQYISDSDIELHAKIERGPIKVDCVERSAKETKNYASDLNSIEVKNEIEFDRSEWKNLRKDSAELSNLFDTNFEQCSSVPISPALVNSKSLGSETIKST